jgi:hypothetical protein
MVQDDLTGEAIRTSSTVLIVRPPSGNICSYIILDHMDMAALRSQVYTYICLGISNLLASLGPELKQRVRKQQQI